jgi:NAD+ kinase
MNAIGIVANPHKASAADTVRRLQKLLTAAGIAVRLESGTARLVGEKTGRETVSQLANHTDLLIVLGGDGTMLRVARELEGSPTPILGVNLGSLGFLTSTPLGKIDAAVRAVLKGQFTVSRRSTLKVCLYRRSRKVTERHALNDVVLTRGEVSRVLRIDVGIGGNSLAEYGCDGIIFATPTGSTAYSLSAAGPILDPEARAYVVTPICPHPVTYRPLVVPHETVVTARPVSETGRPLLTVDGQVQTALQVNDVVELCGSARTVQLVTLRGRSYYDVLREKLKWSRPPAHPGKS